MESFWKTHGQIGVKFQQNYVVAEWTPEADVMWDEKFQYRASPGFNFLNDVWCLASSLDKSGWLLFTLLRRVKSSCKSTVPVCFTLGLKAEDGTLHKSKSAIHCFAPITSNFGWVQVMKREEIESQKNKLCPNGRITVYCKLRLHEKCQADAQCQKTLPYDDSTTLIQNFSDMYLKQQLCDVTINVGNRKFQAHKAILAARSTVFASMFEQDMKEKKSGVIKIDDCDPDAFHHFLLYLYTAKVDIISPKNAVALYCIADKYDVSRLTSSCEQFLLTNLSVELFCDVLVLAKKYDKPTLIKITRDFFAEHAEEILVTEKWQQFLKENSITANELLIKCAQPFKRRRIT